MSYIRRRIEVTVNIGKGAYGDGGFDSHTLKGLRISAQVQKTGTPGYNFANLRIYGMSLSLMNQLSTLGKRAGIWERNNTVSISAGDEGAGLSMVFYGLIQEAWADFQGAPEVYFVIEAHTATNERLRPVPPTSYAGSIDAASVIQTLASQMNYGFENSGASNILSNPYFPGTAMEQAAACAEAAGFGFMADNQTLAIWPRKGSRNGQIPLISSTTGMVGYPSYTGNGVRIRTQYNPQIIFMGAVEVDSTVTPAKGKWTINALAHDLESETVGGNWYTDMEGFRFGESPVSSPG